MNIKRNKTLLSWPVATLILLMAANVHAQVSLTLPGTLLGLQEDDNVLQNGTYLEPFLEKLRLLKNGERKQVNIIHIGDSHIQADYMTEVVRKNLQQYFGNAGRGLIVPARVAGTNEPGNFSSYSTFAWNSKRLVHTAKPLPIGIGGITLQTDNPQANFLVNMKDPMWDYRFNSVSFFYLHDKESFSLSIRDSSLNELGKVEMEDPGTKDDFYKMPLSSTMNYMFVQVLKEHENQNHATLFGLNLENGNPGILYHAIGVNGAKYEHYNAANLFAKQTALLQPDLFIISLGTNESIEYPRINPSFFSHITLLMESLAKNNPEAKFILVTPPDAFIKKTRVNPGIELIRSQILKYAVENGFAFWDMYKVNGGKNSASAWKANGMLRPDGVHFSKDGYAFQGNLLFEAIMKSYNQYVSDRHP
jgi:lysophospholipase L1-like esterase